MVLHNNLPKYMAYLALWTSKPSEQSITSPISEKSGFAIATGLNRTCKNISLKYTEHFTILLELNPPQEKSLVRCILDQKILLY